MVASKSKSKANIAGGAEFVCEARPCMLTWLKTKDNTPCVTVFVTVGDDHRMIRRTVFGWLAADVRAAAMQFAVES